jgi:hypothetical protein
MSFALVTAPITGNGCHTFDFGSKIGSFVYGLQGLSLVPTNQKMRMPGLDDELPHFGVAYTVAAESGVGYQEVTLTQQIAPGLDLSTAADVTVLAFLAGEAPSGVVLVNEPATMGSTGALQYPPENPPIVSCGVLGGFTSAFDAETTLLYGIGAGAGIACLPGSPATVAPVGFGALQGGGHQGFSGSVDAGLVLLDSTTTGEIGAEVFQFTAPSSSFSTQNLGFEVQSCAVLIQSFYTQFVASDNSTESDLIWESLSIQARGSASGERVVGSVDCTLGGNVWVSGNQNPSAADVESTVGSVLIVGIPGSS